MINFIKNGAYMEITAPAAIDSGDGVLVGDLFGVAVKDIGSGAKGNLALEGVFNLEKATGDGGATIWSPAYFNASTKKVTSASTGNKQVGLFANAPGDTDTKALVLLDAQTGEKDEMVVTYASYGAGSKTAQTFFVAPVPMKVLKVSEIHSAAEDDAATLTADIHKDVSTNAPGAGTAVLLGATKINLKAAANTVQSPALNGTASSLLLAAGDRLSFKPSDAGTEIANVVVTVHLAKL
jgi:predicted RecA/RadA family phage recombinase